MANCCESYTDRRVSHKPHRVISGAIQVNDNDRICLYSHFDYENIVDEYVYHAISSWLSIGYKIVFISTCEDLDVADIQRLSHMASCVILRENLRQDFGGWHEVILSYPDIFSCKSLVLANDSVYGPLTDLGEFVDIMNDQGYDFWGMTESFQCAPHLQSYILCFNHDVIVSSAFRSFWLDCQNVKDKQDLIRSYELHLTAHLKEAGFQYGSIFGVCDIDCSYIPGLNEINPTHHLWKYLIEKCNAPFCKVELIRDNPFDLELLSVGEVIQATGYDYSLITNHVGRIAKYYKKSEGDDRYNAYLKKVAYYVQEQMNMLNKKKIKSRKTLVVMRVINQVLRRPGVLYKITRGVLSAVKNSLKQDVLSLYYDSFGHGAGSLSDIGSAFHSVDEYRKSRSVFSQEDVIEANSYELSQLKARHKLAVVCHIFYSELYDEILYKLKNLKSADIYVSLVRGYSDDLLDKVKRDLPGCYVQVFENHGRDIYPFVKFIESGVLYQYELVLKIHGKMSSNDKAIYDFDGDAWRKDSLAALLPEKNIDILLQDFINDTSVGLLCPEDYIYDKEHIGCNEGLMQMLCGTLGMEFDQDELLFPAGTMFWIKPWLLRHIGALDLKAADFDSEPLAVDGSLAHALERFIGYVAIKAGYKISPASPENALIAVTPEAEKKKVDVIAFYLPQFHPIEENDRWWGKGFTEWRNVTRAKPVFDSHYQPRVPGELGYYDLRMEEILQQQSKLAEEYGLGAFAFYHYWFSGKKLLSRPIDNFLNNDDINFKFLLCWANENWTRSWDGLNKNILMEQKYEDGWEVQYANDICEYLKSPKYYKRDDKPVLLIYNVSAIPDCREKIDNMRKTFFDTGVGPVEIIAVWFYGVEYDADLYGVDGFSEFAPHRLDFVGASRGAISNLNSGFDGGIYSYEGVASRKIDSIKKCDTPDMEMGIMCGWDNTARRQLNGDIFHGSTPASFRNWLDASYSMSLKRAQTNKNSILFINAWNEWAEGAYLEPDMRYGRGYLEAVKSVVHKNKLAD